MIRQAFRYYHLNGDANAVYCCHPDHLGTANALTDANGTMYQFFLNLPFGEPSNSSSPTQLNYIAKSGQTLASQSSTSYYQSEFKFNDDRALKKCPVDIFSDGASMPRWPLLDTETGLYYYGARYYDPSLSVWLSVDPLAEQFPNFSPYNYTMNNPINLIDPDGRAPSDSEPPDGTYLIVYGSGWYEPVNKSGDQGGSFKRSAEARKAALIKSGVSESSIVLAKATTEQEFVDIANTEYSSGKIVQLDIYSHMSNNAVNFGGEVGDEPNNASPADKDYRLLNFWSSSNYNPQGDNEILKINAGNFNENGTVNLWGCNAGYYQDNRKYALGQGFANHLGMETYAFDSYSEFKTKNGSGKNRDVYFDGEMIRTKDRSSQNVVRNKFTRL